MKKLILLLFIPIVFTCNADKSVDTFSEYEGLWSGSFEQIDNGTWTFSVDGFGNVEGSITSFDENKMYRISGNINENGYLETIVSLIGASKNTTVGSLNGTIESDEFSGAYTNENNFTTSILSGDVSTEYESQIINTWYLFSAEYLSTGAVYYSDNPIYCPELSMQFNSDGTFTDYFVADYSDNPDPICNPEDAFFGTFSVQEDYYQFTYEAGGNQDLSGSDIYISYPDSNTMNYMFQNVLWTYKISISP